MKDKEEAFNIIDEHFKILNGITQLTSVFKQQEKYRKDIIEAQRKMQKVLRPVSISKLSKKIEKSLGLAQISIKVFQNYIGQQ